MPPADFALQSGDRTHDRTPGRMHALDGLRGLAVLIVLASHFSNGGLIEPPAFAGSGKSGVYLFFVLSAYLLLRPYLEVPPATLTRPIVWARYAARRILRIWPLFLVVLAVSYALTTAGVAGWHYRIDARAFFDHVLLRRGDSVLWSIPVEFTFYAVLPAVLALVIATRRAVFSLLALAAAAVIAALLWPPAATPENDVRLGPYLGVFLCGAAAACACRARGAGATTDRTGIWALVGISALSAWVATLPAVLPLWTGYAYDPTRNHRWFLFFGALWAVLLLAVVHGPRWFSAPFRSAPMRWAGRVSYSAYLWHMPVLDGLRHLGAGRVPGGWITALVAVVVVAAVSYILVERPLQSLRPFSAAAGATGGPDSAPVS